MLLLLLGCDIHVDLDKTNSGDTGEPDTDTGGSVPDTADSAADEDTAGDTAGPDACDAGVTAWIPNTNTAYDTIQAAIDASGWRDTVRVCPGTWSEALVLREGTLTIEGYGSGTTILDGGGVSRVFDVPTGAVPRIQSLTVQNGAAVEDMENQGGGGLYANGADVTLEHVTFSGNFGGRAGAVRVVGGTLTIRDSVFADNTAYSTGGAVTTEGSTYLEVEASAFERNTSGSAAGAVYVYHTDDATLTDCVFTVNESDGDGGAISVYGEGSTTINRGTFTDNVSGNDGGAVDVSRSVAVSVTDSAFMGNQAHSGAGIALSEGTLTVTGSTFDGNQATYEGGAIDVTSGGSQVTIDTSEFTGNTAVHGGGAVSLYGDLDVAVQDSTFSANDGEFGGAFNVTSRDPVVLSLDNTTIDANTAFYGSAFEISQDVVLDMVGGAVTRNVAMGAAALRVTDGATVTVDGTDWGEGATDNLPEDIWEVATGYGAGASFTCTSSSSYGVDPTCE